MSQNKSDKMILELFFDGCRKGWKVALEGIMPAMIFAYVLISILKQTGLDKVLTEWLGPVMAIWGLPGEAAIALISAFFAKAAGAGATAALYQQGKITAAQATMLFPACILMGTFLGHYVRVIVTSGTNARYHGLAMGINVATAALSMWVTGLLLKIMGLN